jgi:translation elongation factor EF-4
VEEEMLFISAKTGQGVDSVLDSIINRIDPPVPPKKDDPLRCFLFDARYVPNRGVACLVKIMGGSFLDFQKLKMLTSFHTGKRYDLYDIGVV